jgi:hypothetical protein
MLQIRRSFSNFIFKLLYFFLGTSLVLIGKEDNTHFLIWQFLKHQCG